MSQALNISDIQLFNVLKTKFSEKEAEQVVSLIKKEIEETSENKQQILIKDIDVLREDVNKDFKYFRDEIIRVFANKEDLQKTKSELIMWAFVFWVTQLGAIFAFLKFFK